MNFRSPIKYAATTLALGFGLAVAVPAAASANTMRPDPTAVEYAVGTSAATSAYGTWDYMMKPDPTAVEYAVAVKAGAVHPDGTNWDNVYKQGQ